MEEIRRQLQNTPEQNRREIERSERRRETMGDSEGNRHMRRKAAKMSRRETA